MLFHEGQTPRAPRLKALGREHAHRAKTVASTRTGPKSSAIIGAPGEKCGLPPGLARLVVPVVQVVEIDAVVGHGTRTGEIPRAHQHAAAEALQ